MTRRSQHIIVVPLPLTNFMGDPSRSICSSRQDGSAKVKLTGSAHPHNLATPHHALPRTQDRNLDQELNFSRPASRVGIKAKRPSGKVSKVSKMPKVPKTPYKRASFACSHCHASKVKCDIVKQGFPCSTCKSKGFTDCQLFQSKRRQGRNIGLTIPGYGKRADSTTTSSDPYPVPAPDPDRPGNSPNDDSSLLPASSPRMLTDKVSSSRISEITEIYPDSEPIRNSSQKIDTNNDLPNGGHSSSANGIQDVSLSPFPLQLTASPGPSGNAFYMPKSPSVGGNHHARNESTPYPSTMFLSLSGGAQEALEFVLGSQSAADLAKTPGASGIVDKNVLTYVGMASPLSVLLRRLRDTGHVSVTKLAKTENCDSSISGTFSASTLSSTSSESSASALSSNVPLKDSAVAKLPPGGLEDLVSSYFAIIHPFYPVINRRWFADRYFSNTVPQLLLNAVCFAACYHCDPATIHRAGFASRRDAKEAFYRDAKRLYYDEHEQDLVVILQACILLSFYGGQPRSAWNCRSWLAIAVTIAEDIGLHSFSTRTEVNENDRSQLKIIWWVLVIRDVMTSSFLGRPQKICDQRCDVDMITLDDFMEVDRDPESPIFGRREVSSYHFLIETSKALEILMKIFSARFYPRSDPRPSMDEYKQLIEWKQNLPDSVNWLKNPHGATSRYLGMIYHHLVIFVFRPRMVDSEQAELCSMDEAVGAATEIAKLVGKIGLKSTLDIPQDMYMVLVTAMGMLITDYRNNHSEVSKLHLQVCMMTLTQARESWDHAWWLMDMFEHMVEDEPRPEASGRRSPAVADNFDIMKSLFGMSEF